MQGRTKEPKLFYRFINGKIKYKENINRLKENNEVYEDPKEMSEVLNKNFRNYLQLNLTLKSHKDKWGKTRCGKSR